MRGQAKAFLGLCMGLALGAARGQTLTYPGCSNPTSSEFPVTELAANKGLQEPVGFDLQSVWNAAHDSVVQTNIFFVERMGKVKFYNGATGTVKTVATIPVAANSAFKCCGGSDDNGLMGVALDPNFNTNRWIYLWYGPPPPDSLTNPRLHLSRFTVKANDSLDMGSEKILIDLLTSKGEHRHAGGPMTFDAHGDLWVTLGQSGNDIDYPLKGSQWQTGVTQGKSDSALNQEWGPSNTASLRGGIMRIHPDDAATSKVEVHSGVYGPGYTVPAGNFGEYWSTQFQSQGKTDLATQYKDNSKVLPEVYVKGNRSPFSIGVHPYKQWLAWGEVNPTGFDDEINLVTHPIFAGHPYFIANNRVDPYPGTAKDPNAPTNTGIWNNGVTQLPPAIPGTLNGGAEVGNVAMAGPFYVYNWSLRNKEKLPPHFDNHFFHLSFQANTMYVNTLDTVTGAIKKTERIENGLFRVSLRSPLAARVGGDGALYVLNYDGYYNTQNPAVERITYNGKCFYYSPSTAVRSYPKDFGVRLSPMGFSIEGKHAFTIRDLNGRTLISRKSGSSGEYLYRDLRVRNRLPNGLALLNVVTERGRFTEKILY